MRRRTTPKNRKPGGKRMSIDAVGENNARDVRACEGSSDIPLMPRAE